MQAVGRGAAVDGSMAVDFEVGDDFPALDFHHARILRSAPSGSGLGVLRRSAMFDFILSDLSDDLVLRGGDMLFEVTVVHVGAFVKRRPACGLLKPRQG